MDRKIDMIVIHCSDSGEDQDIGVTEIESWHKARAEKESWSWFKDLQGLTKYIGYHYIVRRNGFVEVARPISNIGCHAKGVNKNSIGVCWIGRKHMAEDQKNGLVNIIASLCVSHGLLAQDIYGHYQFAKHKTCPNFDSPNTFESMDHFRTVVEMAIRDLK